MEVKGITKEHWGARHHGGYLGRRARTDNLPCVECDQHAIALYAFAFQFLRIGDPTFHARFDTTPVMAALHVIGGGFALLAGGFQFSRALRTSRPALQRWLGRFYLLVVLVGAIRGAVVAWLAWVPNLIVAEWLVLRRASE